MIFIMTMFIIEFHLNPISLKGIISTRRGRAHKVYERKQYTAHQLVMLLRVN